MSLRAPALAAALLLAAVAGVCAWRYGADAVRAGPGAFGEERAPRARALLARLLDGLAAIQDPDGGFALDPPEDRPKSPLPEVKRTAATALAAWALGMGVEQEAASERARAAVERARGYLVDRQEGDGALGRMPAGALGRVDRGPEVTAMASALLALSGSTESAHALLVGRVTRALAPVLSEGLRDGWQRAIVAMAIDRLVAAGRGEGLGLDPRRALPAGETRVNPDCGDYRLAEAIVRLVREAHLAGDLYPEAVLTACLTREPLTWSGQTTDVQSWLLQAWLARRSHQARPWFASALEAVEEAVGTEGLVPASIYADRVTQAACAALVLALGLSG